MPGLTLVTPPSVEPFLIAEAKLFLKVDVTDDDTFITDLVAGARKKAEEFLGQSLLTQTWDYYLDEFPRSSFWQDCAIVLPRYPVQSVTTIKYTDWLGNVVTVSSATYQVDLSSRVDGVPRSPRIYSVVGQSWPLATLRSLNGVEVRFVAGYGAAASNVPEHMRLALKQLVNLWYYNRDMIGQIPEAIGNILVGTPSGFAYA